jgi:hypothetical protein
MSVSIGEVQSDVLVEPPDPQSPAAQGKTLAPHEELARWLQLARHVQWDEARTSARDFDD